MKQKDFKSWETHLAFGASITCTRKILTETLCDFSRCIDSTALAGDLGLDPKTGQLVLTYHPDHVWIKTSHDLSQPWQEMAIREKAASTNQPPALNISPIP